MSKPKKPAPKSTSKSKPAPAKSAPKPKSDTTKPTAESPAKRKIGERTETVQERLSLGAIEDQRKQACELMRQKEELDERRKSVNADYKAKIADVESKMKACLSAAANGNRSVEIVVEEWLTDRNQVERYRKDTRERIGDRTASIGELQETLALPDPDDSEDDDGDPDYVESEAGEPDAVLDGPGDLEDKLAAAVGDDFGG